MYRVVIHKKVSKEIEDLPLHVSSRIILRLRELEVDPRRGSKHLKGEYHCFWRLRVGYYRLIYRVNDKENRVEIIYIWRRGQAYKKKGRKRG